MKYGISRMKFQREGGARLYIPAELVRDPRFPFENGDLVKIEIGNNSILVKKPEWWEMIDWNEMPEAYERLPEDIKKKIREKGLAPK
ncbi:MAG: hypothetical protein DRO18_02470 [Thermoprotei archaeon]|nr:MAG: hypothetical protein DRO18_02470 [Thermoprotei archaeon]